MYGINQNGDDIEQLHHPDVNLEGNIYTQQEKLKESIKNWANVDNSSTKSPYQQINLQVLSPSNPALKNDMQIKNKKTEDFN